MADRAQTYEAVTHLLALGRKRKEVAKELGISYSYVAELVNDPSGEKARMRKEKYRVPCPQCGTLMHGSSGWKGQRRAKLCQECMHEKQIAARRWTREAIITAIQLFASRHGRPPLATEWAQPLAIRGNEYPPLSEVYRYHPGTRGGKRKGKKYNPFTSWGDAIEAAGFPRPKPGHKVKEYGQGVSTKMRKYVVLHKEEDGRWAEMETVGVNPENAIERVAFKEGEYFALPKKLFVVRSVRPKTAFEVMASTPGGKEE